MNIFAALLFGAVLAVVLARPPVVEASSTAPQAPQAPGSLPQGYVGAETCAGCHT
jgi:hypothetical protein